MPRGWRRPLSRALLTLSDLCSYCACVQSAFCIWDAWRYHSLYLWKFGLVAAFIGARFALRLPGYLLNISAFLRDE